MTESFATALGFTQAELENYFEPYLKQVSERRQITHNLLLEKLRSWYNGYKFYHEAQTVYNPVSIGKFFENSGNFDNYWFETGNPRLLLDLMKKNNYDISSCENL